MIYLAFLFICIFSSNVSQKSGWKRGGTPLVSALSEIIFMTFGSSRGPIYLCTTLLPSLTEKYAYFFLPTFLLITDIVYFITQSILISTKIIVIDKRVPLRRMKILIPNRAKNYRKCSEENRLIRSATCWIH